jgi:hypothetical protein
VVGTARVSGSIRKSTAGQTVRQYDNEEQLNWAWEVPCDPMEEGISVAFDELKRILKRDGMRIPGGLIEIDKSQFYELRKLLKS